MGIFFLKGTEKDITKKNELKREITVHRCNNNYNLCAQVV